MKTEPTAIDREAATLFTPAPGMRTWQATGAGAIGPRRVIEAESSAAGWIAIRTEGGWSWLPVCAFDTDDPATAGCMLAQVSEHGGSTWLQPLWRVSIPADAPYHGETMATVTGRVWSVMTSTGSAGDGPTEGAALVAAMRALKSAPTR